MSRLSPLGVALAAMSSITILTQLATLYDPSRFMSDYQISSGPAVRLIAFLLILINGYDLIAALQDNWTVYKFSAVSRVAAALLFWGFGPAWRMLAWVELGTLGVLVAGMWVG
ncbi:MAG: hypothetical protein Q9227_007010 [Pyrenula ochraceoflavens]